MILLNEHLEGERLAVRPCKFQQLLVGNDQYIYNEDGYIGRFFHFEYNLPILIKILDSLSPQSYMQIYRQHRPSASDVYAVAVFAKMDYSFLNIPLIETLTYGIFRIEKYKEKLLEATRAIKEYFHKIIPETMEDISVEKSEIISRIRTAGFVPQINLSVVRTDKSAFSQLLYVNNPAMFPSRSFLGDFSFIQCYTIIKPSEQRHSDLIKNAIEEIELLMAMSKTKAKSNGARVHTIIDDGQDPVQKLMRGVNYISLSFMITSNSFSSLDEECERFSEICNRNEVVLYRATNHSVQQYVSMMPGNALSGSHYFTALVPHIRLSMHPYLTV